jgi:AraC-like DNA-binding protein
MDQFTAYRASGPRTGDRVRFWREPRLDNLECLEARFRNHRYTPHVHDTFAIGVIVSGVELFRCRGARHRAGPGQVVAVNPGELHDGEAAGDGFGYRMLYPSTALLDAIAREHSGPVSCAALRGPVIDDPGVARGLVAAHRLMARGAPRLAVDSALGEALALLVERHADPRAPARRHGRASAAVRRACEFVDACCERDLTLCAIAAIACIDRFALIRAFRRELGVTPHAFLTARRVARAKRLLGGDGALSTVALECGFCDQSHFTRTFKAWTGITPGHYRDGIDRAHRA